MIVPPPCFDTPSAARSALSTNGVGARAAVGLFFALSLLVAAAAAQADMRAAREAWDRQDFRAALPHLEEGARQGDSLAQTLYAQLLANGKAGPRDLARAAQWFERAAAADPDTGPHVAHAQFNLASLYWTGEAVPQDRDKAVLLYEQSARNGFAEAQTALAGLYYSGKGVGKDVVESVAWDLVASAGGHAKAQQNVLLMRLELDAEQWREARRRAHGHAPQAGFDQEDTIELEVPPGWTELDDEGGPDRTSYFPAGETAQSWTEMLSVRQIPVPLNLLDLSGSMLKRWQQFCGKLAHQADPDPANADPAATQRAHLILLCDRPLRRGLPSSAHVLDREVLWIAFYRAGTTTFEVQRAWHHGGAGAAGAPLNERMAAWKRFFDAIRICATKDGQRHCESR